MKRKLIRQGIGGMTIYLPKKWVDEHRLGNGDEIEVEPLESDLLISARAVDYKSTTAITLTHLTESSIRTLITNTYRSGYDVIKVSFESEHQFEILRHVIKTRLIGFEVTKRAEKSCMVENITEPSADQFDTLVRKYLYSISDLLEEAKRHFETGVTFDFEEIEERIQRYDNFCRRILAKRKVHIKNSEMLWTVLALFLHGQREIYHMLKIGQVKLSPGTRRLFAGIVEIFEQLKRAYIDRNIAIISEIHERYWGTLFKDAYALLERSKGKETIALYHITASARMFYQVNSPLTGYLV